MKMIVRVGFVFTFLISVFYLQYKFDYNAEENNLTNSFQTGNLHPPLSQTRDRFMKM